MDEIVEEGFVEIFFQLNGQPRTIKLANRQVAATVERHPQAGGSNPHHVLAPMSGVISSIAVNQGQSVESGDLFLNIEAIKMEFAIRTARSGTIRAIIVKFGLSVDAKGLLLEFASDEDY